MNQEQMNGGLTAAIREEQNLLPNAFRSEAEEPAHRR